MEACGQNVNTKYVKLVICYTLNPKAQDENKEIVWNIIKPFEFSNGYLNVLHKEDPM